MDQKTHSAPLKKKNVYISYLNGTALISIALIHLIDWSNISLSLSGRLLKEFLYTGIFTFVLTTGSLIVIAYEHNTSLRQTFDRLLYRGSKLLFLYYLYSIIKLAIFNFSTEPFYGQFINIGKFTIPDILAFRSFSVPLTVLITYAFFLALSPLFLYIHKRSKYPKTSIALIIITLFILDYATNISSASAPIIKFLYANGYVLFPIALWLIPFLIGFFMAQIGFEKRKKTILITSGILTLICGISSYFQHRSLFPSDYRFPLAPYFIAFGSFIISLQLYIFDYLEKKSDPWIKRSLAIIQLLGNNTLYLYLYHWIIIDCTIWIFSPRVGLIWLTTSIFFALYILLNKNKLANYYSNRNNAINNTI
jgi:hypothetical protein